MLLKANKKLDTKIDKILVLKLIEICFRKIKKNGINAILTIQIWVKKIWIDILDKKNKLKDYVNDKIKLKNLFKLKILVIK